MRLLKIIISIATANELEFPGSPCYLGGSFDVDLCSPECTAINIGRQAIKKMMFGNDSATYQVFGTESSFTKFCKVLQFTRKNISKLDNFKTRKRPQVKVKQREHIKTLFNLIWRIVVRALY